MKSIVINFFMNYVVLILLVVVRWATIQGATGVEAITIPILILLLAVSLISVITELMGMVVASIFSVVSTVIFPPLLIAAIILFIPLVGWITMGSIELLNFGFNYQEGIWYQDFLAYSLLGLSYGSKVKATITTNN